MPRIASPERNQEILAAIVRLYVATGKPVASASIAGQQRRQLSAATIRNIMSQLEQMGYLEQPHPSAGRVPTVKAYEFYAQQAMRRAELASADRDWIDAHLLAEGASVETILPRASHVLSELMHGIGIVVCPPVATAVLEQIRFVRVAARRILVVVVTRNGWVWDKLVGVHESFSQQELDDIAAYLNHNFAGRTLEAIRHEIEQRAAAARVRYKRLVRNVAVLCQGLNQVDEPGHVYVEGAANLMDAPTLADQEELSALLHMLEEKEKLVRLLSAALEGPEPVVRVIIGLESLSPAIKHFALISAPYGIRGRCLGSLGILGPTRMDYPRAITAVNYVARLFSRVLNEN